MKKPGNIEIKFVEIIEESTSGMWMIPYGNLMTVLMILFLILYLIFMNEALVNFLQILVVVFRYPDHSGDGNVLCTETQSNIKMQNEAKSSSSQYECIINFHFSIFIKHFSLYISLLFLFF